MHLRHQFPSNLLVLLLMAPFAPASGQIYGGADSRGVVVLSNFSTAETPDVVIDSPPAAAAVLAVVSALAALPTVPLAMPPAPRLPLDPLDPAALYRSMIEQIAREVSVSPQLLRAVIRVESAYQPNAVSRKGAIGLMQLMPATAQRFGVRNAFDPQQNVRGGALYLKWLLEYFHGDLRLALAAYNAGEAAVVKAGYRIPPIAETRDYVPKVLWHINHLVGNG